MIIHHMIFQQDMFFLFFSFACCVVMVELPPLGGGRLSRALLRPLRAMDLGAA